MARKKKEDKDSPPPPPPVTKDYDYSKDTGDITPEELIQAAIRAGEFVYDLETTGLNPRAGRIEGIAFYIPAKREQKVAIRAWFPFTDNTMVYTVGKDVISLRLRMNQQDTMDRLRPIFLLPDVVKITANGKFDEAWLKESPGTSHNEPIYVASPKGDSMLCDYVADERHRRYGLKVRYEKVFNERMTTYEEASQRQGQFSFMNPKPLGIYAMDDCMCTYRLHEWAMDQVRRQDPSGKLEKIYWQIEMKLRDVIMEMETSGCLIDWEHLVELERRLEKEKSEIVTEIVNKAGWAPNLRSPKQVSDFLFNPPEEGGLGLPTEGLEQGVDGDYSTSEKVIKHFGRKNGLVQKLLDYRSLEVIDRSFCKKLIKIAQEEGRVYAGFNQTGTVIGRLSSSKPINMQNQPREKNMIRKAYCACLPNDTDESRRDLLLFDADYGQVELRMAAHLAREHNMLDVYNAGKVCPQGCERFIAGYECKIKGCKWEGLIKNGQKICGKCGSDKVEWQERCRHIDLHQRTSEDVGVVRNPLAKNLNFGLLYRMGGPKFVIYADLYDDDGQPKTAYARELIDKWHEAYPGIAPWHWEVEEELKRNNWIAYTLCGRRRRLDEEKRFNEFKAITQAIQFKVSGSCQDIIKLAMIRIYEERNARRAKAGPAEKKLWDRVRFLIQVHDEIMLEGPSALRDELVALIKDKMENVAKLRVPLVASVKVGRTWEDAH